MAAGMRITYLGQSGFAIEFEDSTLLVDPPNKETGNQSGDLVYVTHKHFDHAGGLKAFMERNPEAELIANEQVLETFHQWPDRSTLAETGKTYSKGYWNFEFVESRHGLFRGIQNVGAVIHAGGQVFCHVGDTVTLAGFRNYRIDFLAVPVSGVVATKAKDVVSELKKFDTKPQYVIPMHWLFRNPQGLCKLLKKEMQEVGCLIPEKGQVVIG
jgi:L-ascorbate metabolism protein UlaG (beta-lactamase superfamily)